MEALNHHELVLRLPCIDTFPPLSLPNIHFMRKKSNSVSVGRSLEVLASSNDVAITDYLDRPSHRRKKLNQYIRGERVGKGRHGEVYMGQDTLHDHRDVVCGPLTQTLSRLWDSP